MFSKISCHFTSFGNVQYKIITMHTTDQQYSMLTTARTVNMSGIHLFRFLIFLFYLLFLRRIPETEYLANMSIGRKTSFCYKLSKK